MAAPLHRMGWQRAGRRRAADDGGCTCADATAHGASQDAVLSRHPPAPKARAFQSAEWPTRHWSLSD
eukprot:6295246-Pyramimonas_sp.AAC.1